MIVKEKKLFFVKIIYENCKKFNKAKNLTKQKILFTQTVDPSTNL
jgi:hypothetical protein